MLLKREGTKPKKDVSPTDNEPKQTPPEMGDASAKSAKEDQPENTDMPVEGVEEPPSNEEDKNLVSGE